MTENASANPRPKRRRDDPISWFSIKRNDEKPKKVKVEKNVKRRVLRLGKMGRHHASEACEPAKVTSKDMAITREVVESLDDPAPTPAQPETTLAEQPRPGTFKCAQCGADVPFEANSCPGCGCRYLNDITDEELSELESAEREAADGALPESPKVTGSTEAPCIHFDAESGTVEYLQSDHEEPNVSIECGNCGTEIEFEADRCPICGASLKKAESGLVGLFKGMEFDVDDSPEMDCPFCGEHVVLEGGVCPECRESVRPEDEDKDSETIEPVIHMDNVVFLHLDVSTGEVNFLQKLARNRGFEQVTVQLEGIGRSGFDKDWKSLSRV